MSICSVQGKSWIVFTTGFQERKKNQTFLSIVWNLLLHVSSESRVSRFIKQKEWHHGSKLIRHFHLTSTTCRKVTIVFICRRRVRGAVISILQDKRIPELSWRRVVSPFPITLVNISSINLVSIYNPVYPRRVDSSPLVFSLSSYRHSYIVLVFDSHFIDSE